jgi:hypothetical protein
MVMGGSRMNASHEPAPAKTRAEHDRAAFLNVHAFGVAERAAEGARQAAVAAAAAELQALGNANRRGL